MDQDLKNAIDEAFCARSEAFMAGGENADGAAAFIASLAASGYAIVPVEATQKMVEAFVAPTAPVNNYGSQMLARRADIWRAMLAAAQQEKPNDR